MTTQISFSKGLHTFEIVQAREDWEIHAKNSTPQYRSPREQSLVCENIKFAFRFFFEFEDLHIKIALSYV